MICRKCGAEIPDNSIRCNNCKVRVNMYCPNCHTLNLFGKKQVEENEEIVVEQQESSNEFKDSIKMTEEEENELLELQKKYRRGEIAENDLTEEQIDALCDLYDKQIEDIKQSIKIKEEKIAEYKRKIENNNA